jgi:hypothetical protein
MPRFDLYDLDQIDQARARFAELAAPAPSAEPFANAASATDAELLRCFKRARLGRHSRLRCAGAGVRRTAPPGS